MRSFLAVVGVAPFALSSASLSLAAPAETRRDVCDFFVVIVFRVVLNVHYHIVRQRLLQGHLE